MFKVSSLFKSINACSAPAAENADNLKAVLSKQNIGVLSASCCDAMAPMLDEQLKVNLQAAVDATGDKRQIALETVTTAQKHLRQPSFEVTADEKQLIESIMRLFQAQGMSIFPMLIVNGRVASYGGVPSVDDIKAKLQMQVQTVAG